MRTLALAALLLAACSSTETTNTTNTDAGGDDSGPGAVQEAGADAATDGSHPVTDSGADAGGDADAGNGLFATCAPEKNPNGCPASVKADGYDAQAVFCFPTHNDPDNPLNDIYGRCVFPCGIDDPINGTSKEDPQKSAMCTKLGGICRPAPQNGSWWCTPMP
ncbi:hypothetical protein [Labilithrix luteola]|uniref:hypothetical protein n=1 Tax=Labilithrix luteola TaxID=1391654 RepID=UPI0011BA62BC|nr:hypothetical protein [Labilithrix luteola]